MILLSKKGKETSSMRILYATFVVESEDHISPRFQHIFTLVAVLTFIMQLAYLGVFLFYVVLQIGSQMFSPPYKSCGGYDLYQYPAIIFSLSLIFLLVSFVFFFTIILYEWKLVQDVVYKICPCFARPGYDVSDRGLTVPGEENPITLAMKGATLNEGEPTIVRSMPRTISVLDDFRHSTTTNPHILIYPGTPIGQFKPNDNNEIYHLSFFDNHSKEQDGENSLPRSPRLGNHSCKRTQLLSIKKRTSSLFHEPRPLKTLGEETDV